MEPLWDIHEVAKRLNTSVRHVRRLVLERRIPFTKVGHFLRFEPTKVEAWIRDHQVDVEAPTPIRTLATRSRVRRSA